MRQADSEQFIYTGRAFLSLLTTVDGEYLRSIQRKLLPHSLSLDSPASPSFIDTRTPRQYSFYSDLQPCSTASGTRNSVSRHESDQGETYATSATKTKDRPLVLQAINSIDTRESLLSSFQTRLDSVSPSLLSSDWHGSPARNTEFTLLAGSTVTHWVHSYAQLCNLYGENYEMLKYIVKVGDVSFREDAKGFIDLFCFRWGLENPWNRLSAEDPTSKGSLTERILKSLHCAETIEFESAVDPAKLRMARMLLHHHYEQKCIELSRDPKTPSYLSQGIGIASVANNAILDGIYGRRYHQLSEAAKKKRFNRYIWHKRIGKRWSFVASHVGIGIILTCSPELATHVTSPKMLSDKNLKILTTYLVYGYPRGVQVSQQADALVVSILQGHALSSSPIAADAVNDNNQYKQEDERSLLELTDDWQPLEFPGHFAPVIPMSVLEQNDRNVSGS